jgi:hypothetical protein
VIRLFLFCRLSRTIRKQRRKHFKAFFNSAVGVLQTLVIALGVGLGIWGAINLLEGSGVTPCRKIFFEKL